MATTARPDHVTLPRLDVIRAFCFLAVFGSHIFFTDRADLTSTAFWRLFVKPAFYKGDLGVNTFFVLSGFLITFLLIREKRLNGRINVPHFWLRRILRIWPLYFVVVFLGFGPMQWLKAWSGQAVHETANPWHYVFFYSNLDLVHGDQPDSSILPVLWSIAVEEQFYLVWPLLLLLLPSRATPAIFGTVIGASLVFQWMHPEEPMRLWHTFTCMGDLAIGAAAAWYASRPEGPARIRDWPLWAIIGAHAVALVLYLIPDFGEEVWFRVVFATLVAVVILYQAFGR
ncbi:MAG TPA: acyltransferase, partial [Flavobacteriales bacterium]|nr:acyltransferase [Flavobacteriales bacterium]